MFDGLNSSTSVLYKYIFGPPVVTPTGTNATSTACSGGDSSVCDDCSNSSSSSSSSSYHFKDEDADSDDNAQDERE